MVFLVADSSTGDLTHLQAATHTRDGLAIVDSIAAIHGAAIDARLIPAAA
jgi:hypothetical protein